MKMPHVRDVCGAKIWMEPGGPIMLKAIDGNDPIELNAHEAREIAKVLLELADVEESDPA